MASPIVSIETFEITLADGVASASVAISAGDVADCTPRISYRAQNSPEVAHTSLLVRPRFLTGPNRLEVVRFGTDGPITIQVVVIEWDTSLVSVITGSETFTGLTQDVAISAVDLARAWMTFGFDVDAGDSDESALRGMLTTTTNIHFERDTDTTTVNLDWWVLVDLTGGDVWTVQRVIALSIPATTADATITAVALDRTMHFSSQSLSNFGTEPNEWGATFLFNSTTLRYVRGDPAGTAICDAFVVEFALATGVVVQRGSIVMGSGIETGTAAITGLNDLARSFAQAPMMPSGCSSDDNANINTAFGSIEVLNATTVEANAADDSSIETVFFEVVEFEPDRDGEGTVGFDGVGEPHSAYNGESTTALDGSGELHSAFDGASDTALDGSGDLHSALDGEGTTALDGSDRVT